MKRSVKVSRWLGEEKALRYAMDLMSPEILQGLGLKMASQKRQDEFAQNIDAVLTVIRSKLRNRQKEVVERIDREWEKEDGSHE